MHIRRCWPALITLRFGYGHPVRVVYAGVRLMRHKRYLAYHLLLLIGGPQPGTANLARAVRRPRPFNAYTRRGIRLGRQALLLRRGKESQYTKLKSKIF
jgi:hypothetical protein